MKTRAVFFGQKKIYKKHFYFLKKDFSNEVFEFCNLGKILNISVKFSFMNKHSLFGIWLTPNLLGIFGQIISKISKFNLYLEKKNTKKSSSRRFYVNFLWDARHFYWQMENFYVFPIMKIKSNFCIYFHFFITAKNVDKLNYIGVIFCFK